MKNLVYNQSYNQYNTTYQGLHSMFLFTIIICQVSEFLGGITNHLTNTSLYNQPLNQKHYTYHILHTSGFWFLSHLIWVIEANNITNYMSYNQPINQPRTW